MWIVNDPGTKSLAKIAVRDDPGLPPVCAQTCDDAYLEAQKTGKTASICDAESAFKKLYDACKICIEAKSEDPKAVAKSYLEPKFAEFISYCSEDTPSLAPSFYTLATSWAVATFMSSNVPVTVTVLLETSVLRADLTGGGGPQPLPASSTVLTGTSITVTETSSSQTSSTTSTPTITTSSTASFSATTTNSTLPASGEPTSVPPVPGNNGPSPWVWAIIGTVIAVVLIVLGIFFFLYKKGQLQSIKMKLGIRSAQELDGDSSWRTGDKPELHGESSALAITSGPPKELDAATTVDPKELDSGEKPVEMPTEFNKIRETPGLPEAQDSRDTGLADNGIGDIRR